MSAGHGAAWRRRERQLRAWHRHERMTVAMELATALHHSAQRVEAPREGVEGETNDALRRPKPPLPGKRPGVLLDPEPVQVVDAVTSYVAAPGPSSLVPQLAANDALDNATLRFLVARALRDRRRQEEERRKREKEEKAFEGEEGEGGEGVLAASLSINSAARREMEERLDSGGASSKRKRKKRRKRRTPRTSSRSSCGRSRRRQRQWRVRHAGFAGSCAPRDVFPVACVWPLLLGNTASMDQKDSIFVVVSYEIYSGMCVSTAPVAEPTVMSFTVPLNGWTIVATTTVVTLCSSSADCLATGVFASRCRLVVVFLSCWCLRFCLGQCEADCWKIPHQLFPASL